MKTRWLSLAACAASVALTATACGGDSTAGGDDDAVAGTWEEVVAAAEEEGEVTLYSSHNPVNLEALKAAFEGEYPDITLEFVRGTDAEMNPKVEVENQTGRGIGDVHMVTDSGWIRNAAESGTFSSEIVGPDFDAEEFDRSSSVLEDRLFLSSAAVFAMGWNTNELPDGLSDPRDLLDPSLKGKIGITNPAGIAAYVDFYKFMEANFGDDYLTELAELEPRIYPSSLGIAQALTSGEIVATPVVQPLVAEVSAGAPVDWALPTPPWGAPWFSHALSAAPHPNAAQVLANFLVTRPGQEALSPGYAAVLPDIEGAVARAQDVALPDPAELTTEKNNAYQTEWEGLFLN